MTSLKYELRGFDGIILDEDMWMVLESQYISRIRLTNDFKILEIILKENILYRNNQEPIEKAVTEIFVNILLKIKGHFQCPELVLTDIMGEDNGRSENRIFIANPPSPARLMLKTRDVYKNIVEDNFTKNAEVEWKIIYAMLHNENKVVSFMSLYDYLMEMLWQIHHPSDERAKQYHVISYLEEHKEQYGDDLIFFKVNKNNKEKTVDILTYRRNEIGHARMKNDLEEYRNLGKRIDDGIIRLTLQVINNVLMEQKKL